MKTWVPFFITDCLLMVMKSATFVWHPGPYTKFNTTLVKDKKRNLILQISHGNPFSFKQFILKLSLKHFYVRPFQKIFGKPVRNFMSLFYSYLQNIPCIVLRVTVDSCELWILISN